MDFYVYRLSNISIRSKKLGGLNSEENEREGGGETW
jgi:hypothetical protein